MTDARARDEQPDTPDADRPLASRVAGIARVRAAGPAGLSKADRDAWDNVDQAADESFPASDPPGQGVG